MNAEIRKRMAEAEQEKKRLEQEMHSAAIEKERMDRQKLIDLVKAAQDDEIRQLKEQMETFKNQADAKAKEV